MLANSTYTGKTAASPCGWQTKRQVSTNANRIKIYTAKNTREFKQGATCMLVRMAVCCTNVGSPKHRVRTLSFHWSMGQSRWS
mmetsp:Transcript_4211/g.8414  ORF Transcript_4211/g.8414 Transcript_4211/m.8414 type:complete len:83 (+) Transcript_4211:41-289(+)